MRGMTVALTVVGDAEGPLQPELRVRGAARAETVHEPSGHALESATREGLQR